MNLQNVAATPGGPVQVSVPSFSITAQVFDNDGRLVADLTGASAINFPADLAKIPAARRQVIYRYIAMLLIQHFGNFPDER
jgi:hypothetical protein